MKSLEWYSESDECSVGVAVVSLTMRIPLDPEMHILEGEKKRPILKTKQSKTKLMIFKNCTNPHQHLYKLAHVGLIKIVILHLHKSHDVLSRFSATLQNNKILFRSSSEMTWVDLSLF